MVPDREFYVELALDAHDKDNARLMRGKLIAVIGELRGLDGREIEAINANITRTHEEWIPKFQERGVRYPRRLVFVGTTNRDEFLADATGKRRWLPVRVRGAADGRGVARIGRDRGQLWAEALAMWRAGAGRLEEEGLVEGAEGLFGGVDGGEGAVDWRGAQSLAGAEHVAYTTSDPWEDALDRWLDSVRVDEDADFDAQGVSPLAVRAGAERVIYRMSQFTAGEAFKGMFGGNLQNFAKRDQMRLAALLRERGFGRATVWFNGSMRKIWQLAEKSRLKT
jgi:predicted P-loop ATPase